MEQEENKLYMNGQEVQLKNPGTKGLADFLKIARAMSKMPKDQENANFMEHFDDNAIEATVRLINLTLEKSFPLMKPEEREAWGMENSMLILPQIIMMCSPKGLVEESKRKQELLKRLDPK